ncbi:MAG: hypothetical protein DSM107014_16685 [Gomphosphaeria aponina SAG 52.96 = DSM 107014]|uniref:Addiction module toxin RelE n=1 Tax=Gomphosphaeria aponina SAG 52.96 = DSM 107014 TaxID=1521640 RepID=A0A941GTX5_9CHRO|nr:hypothetical protein [Gomphosphaeria aponina SAG 52.96 = DSM 107014]
MAEPYSIEFSPEAEIHLRTLTARQQQIVLNAIVEQLTYQPTVETKNRKKMRSNPLASWELRVSKLRVYYDIEEAAEQSLLLVAIRAVGVKERNQVFIGGAEIEL